MRAEAERELSGPVLRDAARLSQRYPPLIARYGVFGVSTWPMGCDTPPPFLSLSPLESMRRQKVHLSDTYAIPIKTRQNARDTPLCDTISKGYCSIWGSISHWASKNASLGPSDVRCPPKLWGSSRLPGICSPTKNLPSLSTQCFPPPLYEIQLSCSLVRASYRKEGLSAKPQTRDRPPPNHCQPLPRKRHSQALCRLGISVGLIYSR